MKKIVNLLANEKIATVLTAIIGGGATFLMMVLFDLWYCSVPFIIKSMYLDMIAFVILVVGGLIGNVIGKTINKKCKLIKELKQGTVTVKFRV